MIKHYCRAACLAAMALYLSLPTLANQTTSNQSASNESSINESSRNENSRNESLGNKGSSRTSASDQGQLSIARSSNVDKLETIEVTASRHPMQNNQYAVTAIDADQYQMASHISEAVVASPGIWISRGNGQEHLTAIRSPVFVGAGACGPFMMSEDGISLRAPNFCNVNQLFDANYLQADRIEVLRGAGSLSYANTLHGIINIVSPEFLAPSNRQTRLSFLDNDLGLNRYAVDHRDEKWIAQAMIDDDSGYKKDSGYDQAKLRIKYLQHNANNFSLAHHINYMQLDQDTAGYIVGEDAYKDDDLQNDNDSSGAFRKAEAFRYAADMVYSPKDNASLIFTPYLRANDMEFKMFFLPGKPLEENGHRSAGFKASYLRNYQAWRVQTGFEFDYSSAYLRQTQFEADQFGGNLPHGKHYDYMVDAAVACIFFEASYPILDQLQLDLGLRGDHSRFNYDNKLADGSACDASIAIQDCRYFRPADDNDVYQNWSSQLGLLWALNRSHSVSLNLARHYRVPQATELYRLEQGQLDNTINAERGDSVEVNYIAYLPNWQYAISAYFIDKHNVIVKNNDRINVDGQKTQHQGVELSLSGWLVAERLELELAYTHNRHQYNSNVQLLFLGDASIKGNDMDTAPRNLASGRLNFITPFQSELSLEAVFIDQYYLNPENSETYPGHTLTNLYFQQSLPWRIDVTASIKNLFDINYADRADVQPFSGNTPRYFIGSPRSYQIELSKTF